MKVKEDINELYWEKERLESKIKSMKIEGAIYFVLILFTLFTVIIPIIIFLISISRGRRLYDYKEDLNKIEYKVSKLSRKK